MISRLAQSIAAYTAGEQPGAGYTKLNTNENPYPPAPGVAAVLQNTDIASLRLYPDPNATALAAALARLHGVRPENIYVGNGSDEVLALAFPTFFNPAPAAPILTPDVGYSFYPVYAALYGLPLQRVAVHTDFSVDIADYKPAAGQGVVIANPNAPTSRALATAALEALVQRFTGKIVIIDEAYADFAAENAVGLIDRYDNVCVVRTLSKSYSLAGMRVGYAVAPAPLIAALKKIRDCFNSYPVDALAQRVALAAVRDAAHHEKTVALVCATRARTAAALQKKGCTVQPSAANFLFIRPADGDAQALFSRLRAQKILVRHWNAPRIDEWLRITVGTDAEMDTLLRHL
ncbi:MAG: histidinol-phosphate transaminase [Clostridiales bacterium]|jgi:histidinol-phosphate aminotransferase|nr:histidinol-phosphate transaminase [Clostridiales bacterium]